MYSVARACDAGHVNTKVCSVSCCNIARKAFCFFPRASGRRRTFVSIGKWEVWRVLKKLG